MEPLKKLIVRGTVEDAEDGAKIYYLAASNRDSADKHEIELKEQDPIIELTLDDGSTWMVDSTSMHEVFPEIDPAINSGAQRSGDSQEFEMPFTISAPSSDRGIIGKIAVKLLKVFAKKGIEQGLGKLAKNLEDKHLVNNIDDDSPLWKKLNRKKYLEKGAGLFRVNGDFQFEWFDDTVAADKYFLFIHGTNSDTFGAFQDLQQTEVWKTLHETYGKNVLAFQHRTLTDSPLTNVVKLVEMLPTNSVLHIISHSRGGIVGDILNKYSTAKKGSKDYKEDESPVGFNDIQLSLLEEEGDDQEGIFNRAKDIENIKILNEHFKNNKVTVEKFIRVACPAAGTKLASKRLDIVLNVFSNVFGGTFGLVFKELLSVAVQTKDNVDVLPGLEAQNPDSPFIKVLNDPSNEQAIEGTPLAVVSGNSQVSVSGKGFLVILGKLFFWQRNDLVVNTDSMYLGANRKGDIQYFFDEGNGVDHVKYFINNQTVKAINLAITTPQGKAIPGFNSIKQLEVPASDRALLEHGELYPPNKKPSGTKPIAVILPGIMGSNLEKGNKELWLHYGQILSGGLMNLKFKPGNDIVARSVVKTSYFKLFEELEATYDVTVFPFDWRKPLTESADELNEKIKELLGYQQPIKLIGHSMGGVLVRDFILKHDATWKTLNKRDGFKLLFLGSPLGGSHRILTVLFGEDAIIKKLSKLDLFHSKRRLLTMFSKFPGILALLPLTKGPGQDFANIQTWQNMLSVFGKKRWPLPTVKDLNEFKKYRDNILKKRDKIDYSNMVYVAGKDKMTASGYYLDTNPKEHLYFLYTSEGDQSVTWELGIPEQLKAQNSVYYTKVSHGALANEPDIFKGIKEILEKGETDSLRKKPPISRGEIRSFRAEPDEDFDVSSNGLRNTLFGDSNTSKIESTRAPLSVSVSRGDLKYSAYPLLAGHFLNDAVLFAEKAIDNYMDKKLSHKHELGLYPGAIGTNALFKRKHTHPDDFKGAIIVGMGEPDNLTSVELAKSVEQAVLNYILSLKASEKEQEEVGLSTLVMACGYGGLTIANSMKAIISGINGANNKVSLIEGGGYPVVGKLEFVERYANRSLNCMYVLDDIIRAENKTYHNETKTYNIVLGNEKIKDLLGIRKRISKDNQSSWWNRISVKYIEGDQEKGELDSMVFNASTKDSRVEENQLYSSTPLIDEFIKEISIKNRWTPDTAKALFELLIPNPQKERLKRKGHISWILDEKSASYPWELLQDNSVDAKPLCINAGMIRQLRTTDYRATIKRAPKTKALIIADPELKGYVTQLPGAKKEGFKVEEAFNKFDYPTTTLIGRDASTITKKFFSQDYSVIHLAGHGEFNPDNPKLSGMVIGKKLFLNSFAIEQLPTVPDLVFVNCCHLGYTNAVKEKFYRDRYKLAANIGTQLIRIGVKAVIAAGWAVNDDAALLFAEVFYDRMFNGSHFGDAVKDARDAVYKEHPENNTWGAYQCYGDPYFKLKDISSGSGKWDPHYIVPEEVEIHLDNLLNDIEMGVKEYYGYLDELEIIRKAAKRDFPEGTAEIVEKQARIYSELGMYKEAVDSYLELQGMEKANFSFASMEKFCNTRAKMHVKQIYLTGKPIGDERTTAASKKELQNNMSLAYNKTLQIVDDLHSLALAGETAERLSLIGSTYKRLAMLASTDDPTERLNAYKMSLHYYQKAIARIEDQNDKKGEMKSISYPLANAIELSFILKENKVKRSGKVEFGQVLSKNSPKTKANTKTQKAKSADNESATFAYKIYTNAQAIDYLEKSLRKLKESNSGKSYDHLDYWNMLEKLNLTLCLEVIKDKNPSDKVWGQLTKEFGELWSRAGSPGKKIAELEHFKFLIFGLKTANKENKFTFLPYQDVTTVKDLGEHMEELRERP